MLLFVIVDIFRFCIYLDLGTDISIIDDVIFSKKIFSAFTEYGNTRGKIYFDYAETKRINELCSNVIEIGDFFNSFVCVSINS